MRGKNYSYVVELSKRDLVNAALTAGKLNLEIADLKDREWSLAYGRKGILEFTIWFEDKEEFLNSVKGEKDD